MNTIYRTYITLLAVGILSGCATSQSPTSTSLEFNSAPLQVYTEPETTLSESPSLDEYILYALRESSELEASFNTYQAALLRAPQVSALPEPRLTYAYFLDSIETRVGPMRQKIGLAQPIPWFGKLQLREDIANAEAQAAYQSFLMKKNMLVADVVRAFSEIAYLKSALDITEANLNLLTRWEEVLVQRYRSQTGTQSNLIKVQVELGKLEDKLKELKDLEHPLRAAFNSLLNRPSASDLVIERSALRNINVKEADLILTKTHGDLEGILLRSNPELLLLSTLVEARKKGITLAKKDFYPDFALGVDYTFIGDRALAGSEGGDDAIAPMISLSIPINFSKYRAGLNEAKHRKSSAEQLYQFKRYSLNAVLARSLFDLKDSKRRIDLYTNTLVPKAEESMESTFTSFEAGEASFLDLLDSERVLLDFQLMLSRAQADLRIGESQLRALIGDYDGLGKISKENRK